MDTADLLHKIAEYEKNVPEVDSIPKGPLSVICWMTSHEAQMIPILRSGRTKASDYADILPSIRSKDVFTHLGDASSDTQEWVTCFVAICHGYLATQFCVRGHFAPIHVDLRDLQNALLTVTQDPIGAYSVKDNLEVAFHAAVRDIANSETRYREDAQARPDWFDTLLARCVLQGSLVWHLADSIAFKNGVDVWRDEKDIPVGSSLLGRIVAGIARESDYMVLLMSRASLTSSWVEHEVAQAFTMEHDRDGIYLLPVRLDAFDIPLHLNIKKYADARRSTKAAVRELLSSIKWHGTYMG